MSSIVNWFRIKFDRVTHDAKFEVQRGTSQEINLQTQAALDKANRELAELREAEVSYKTLYLNLLNQNNELARAANAVYGARSRARLELEEYAKDLQVSFDIIKNERDALLDEQKKRPVLGHNCKNQYMRIDVRYSEYNSMKSAYEYDSFLKARHAMAVLSAQSTPAQVNRTVDDLMRRTADSV